MVSSWSPKETMLEILLNCDLLFERESLEGSCAAALIEPNLVGSPNAAASAVPLPAILLGERETNE